MLLTINAADLPNFPRSTVDSRRFAEAHGLVPEQVLATVVVDTDNARLVGHVFDLDEHGKRIFINAQAGYAKTPFDVPLVADPADYGLLGRVGVNA